MDTASTLPHLNAALNAATTVLLIVGVVAARAGRADIHRPVMVAALGTSALFLTSYVIYHVTAPTFTFPGQGWTRPAYFTLLFSHVVLAVVVTPMILLTAWRGMRGQLETHRPLARWTVPLWLYVSVTGVLVYLVLYQVYGTRAVGVSP